MALKNGSNGTSALPETLSSQVPASAPMREVDGKVAFVTGGDSGIGLGIAKALASANMKVVITYRSKAHLHQALEALRGARHPVHAIEVDVTHRTGMADAADETVRMFGKVHVLVNNAGVFPMVSLSSATFDDWDWCMGVNLNGVFNGIRAFLPHIKAHGEGGQVISTASVDGLAISRVSQGVYATSKFAVVGMMEVLRNECAPFNIGVSVFCPGGVNSNILESGRNRPPALHHAGIVSTQESAAMSEFGREAQSIMETSGSQSPMMDPLAAGEHVLRGIRRNDLYILSHPEFAVGIRDRSEALLASARHPPSCESGPAIAELLRNPTYLNEVLRHSPVGAR